MNKAYITILLLIVIPSLAVVPDTVSVGIEKQDNEETGVSVTTLLIILRPCRM